MAFACPEAPSVPLNSRSPFSSYFCTMKIVVTLGFLFLAMASSLGQNDSLPPFQVQIPLDSIVLDTLWTDSTFTWSGPCPSGQINLRFVDLATGQAVQRSMTCTAQPQELSSAYVSPQPAGYVAQINLNRASASVWNWGQPTTCFPPLSPSIIKAAMAQWDILLFERDHLAAMLAWASERCLTPTMVRECLQRLESEDRRLELLQGLIGQCSHPRGIEVTDLFILRSTREKAAALVGN